MSEHNVCDDATTICGTELERLRSIESELSALKRGPDDEAVREALAAVDKYGERQYPTGEDRAALCEAAKVLSASCRKAWAEVAESKAVASDYIDRLMKLEALLVASEAEVESVKKSRLEWSSGEVYKGIQARVEKAEAEREQFRRATHLLEDSLEKAERELAEFNRDEEIARRDRTIARANENVASSQAEVERLRAALATQTEVIATAEFLVRGGDRDYALRVLRGEVLVAPPSPKPCQYCNGVRWIERKPNGPRPCSCNPGARIPSPPKPDEGKPVVHRQTCATERQDRGAHECDCGAGEGKR